MELRKGCMHVHESKTKMEKNVSRLEEFYVKGAHIQCLDNDFVSFMVEVIPERNETNPNWSESMTFYTGSIFKGDCGTGDDL